MADSHYLGEFPSFSAVWKMFPNGGGYGDYVTILGVRYDWNESTNSWGDDPGDVQPPLPEVVNRDIDVQGTGTFRDGVKTADYIPGQAGAFIDHTGDAEFRSVDVDALRVKDPITGDMMSLPDFIKIYKTELPPDWTDYSQVTLFDNIRILAFDPLTEEKFYTSVGALKKLISDSIAASGTGGGTFDIEIIRSDDPAGVPTDNNVLSSLRTLLEIQKAIYSISEQYLSRISDDNAQGVISFLKGIILGNYIPGLVGSGGKIDEFGNGELRSLRLWESLEVPELRYNRAVVFVGIQWQTFGAGIIESVEIDKDEEGNELQSGIIHLKLENGEIGAIAVDDKCQGIYHNFSGSNDTVQEDQRNGNFRMKGFWTSYFKITEILDSNTNSSFRYVLRPISERWSQLNHPKPFMHFACYANPSNPNRQACMYSTTEYSIRLLNMTDWEYGESNIYAIEGKLDGFKLGETVFTGNGNVLGNAYIYGHLQGIEDIIRDEVKVGGRNLLKNSNSFRIASSAPGLTSTITPEGYLQIIAQPDNEDWCREWYAVDSNFSLVESELNEGDDFVISFEVKSPDSTSKPTISIKDGLGYFAMNGTIGTEFSQIWYNGKWKDANIINPQLGFSGYAGTFIFKNWKIEKGNKPTTWAPSPEDIQDDIDEAVIAATYWSIKASSPVIYKDAMDASTSGIHTTVTVSGELRSGSTIISGGFITVTPNGESESDNATLSPIVIAPADGDGKTSYTIRLYDTADKTTPLDMMTIPVVFKGASGLDAINIVLSNEKDVLPASSDGVVSDYSGSGTTIRVFEGAIELEYDGVGTANGMFNVTASASNVTVGEKSKSGLMCVFADASGMMTGRVIITFNIIGKTLSGEYFNIQKTQSITSADAGLEGNGILSIIDYYGVSASKDILPSSWQTNVPTKAANEFLWNYERVIYTDSTYDETEARVIQGKDAKSINYILNAYGYSTNYTDPPPMWYYLSNLPEKQPGQILWVRDDIFYTDGTDNSTTGYPVRDGEPGAGILEVKDWYAVSTDGVNPPGASWPSGWWTTIPAKSANEYLWNYEVITYTDGRPPTETQKRIIQGKDAKSISSISNAYAYSASDTQSPSGPWYSSLSALGTKPAGYFLWVRDDITYTDGTSASTVGYVVRDGEPGADGDGIASTTIEYAKSSSGTTPPGSGWTISVPTPTLGWYLWTRTTTTYKFSPNTVAYSVSRWGNDGNPGLPGIQGPVVFQKEWVQGDTHRYTDYIRDYIYVRGSSKDTSYWYTLSSKGDDVEAGVPPIGGADVIGYDHVDFLNELAVHILIAEEANLANFIFKQEQLISIKGRTYNGTVLNYGEYIDYNFANTVSQPAVDSTSWTDLPSGTIYWVRYKKNTDLTWTVKQIGTGTGQWTLQFATAAEGATWYSSYSSGRYWARAKEGVVPPETTDYGLPFKITMLGEYDFTPNITLAGKDGNVDITGKFSTGNSGNKIVIDPINPEIRLADSGNNILSKIGFRNVTIGSQTYNQPYIELTQPSVSFTPRFISGPGKLELSNVTGFSDTLFLFDAIASKIELGITGSSPSIMKIFINNLPTSSSGLTSGQLWRNGSVINIIP